MRKVECGERHQERQPSPLPPSLGCSQAASGSIAVGAGNGGLGRKTGWDWIDGQEGKVWKLDGLGAGGEQREAPPS